MRGRRYEVRGPLRSQRFSTRKGAQRCFLYASTDAFWTRAHLLLGDRPMYDLIDRKARETLEQWP